MKRFASLLLVLTVFVLFVSATAAQSTIFVVRHAEKAESGGNDPDISEAGRARAESLAKMLKNATTTAIYTTEFKRTQQTATPAAKALGLALTIVPAKDTVTLSAKLRDLHLFCWCSRSLFSSFPRRPRSRP